MLKMLELQRDGMTGHLDSIYELVCGDNNGWLGGTGDGWERGPYWLDGLVPLAYILDDDNLKAKAQKWIEWCFENQRTDGYFGSSDLPDNYHYIPGTQQDMREDWWPKMVMLKVLQQYYQATGDERVINLMTRYFKYQLANLPKTPLGHWTYWAEQRGADNLAVVLWLYNITGDKFLLELGELLHKQTYDWTSIFSGNVLRSLNPMPDLHCVNVAQGLKAPLIYYQLNPDPKYAYAVKQGLEALRDCHGFVNGMYGGDEQLHGNEPSQGSELCSAVEMMFSFESVVPITGDVFYADYIEKIAYNILPSQISDDFLTRQYFQQPNQVLVTMADRNFMNQARTGLVFGTTIGYPCCTCNMHQGWPKFVQNMWYATSDNGIAAMLYGESEVRATVNGGEEIAIIESTDYPFKEAVDFLMQLQKPVKFPFHLRIPLWCENAAIYINGEKQDVEVQNNVVILNRIWKDGDCVSLHMPMGLRTSRWAQNSVGIERGPLVFGLKIEENWRKISSSEYDDEYWEVLPGSNWNYALLRDDLNDHKFNITVSDNIPEYPWNLQNAPIHIKTRGIMLPYWTIDNNSAGKIPANAKDIPTAGPVEEITLVPYGCTTLRISEFPVR